MKTKIIRSAIGSLASNGFLKFLKERDIYVIGTDITNQCVGKFLCDKFYEVPRAINYDIVVSRYAEIALNENASWIISGPETEIEVLIKEREKINCGIFHMPYITFNIITDKYLLAEHFKNDSIIKVPATNLLVDYSEEKLFSKVVLKPKKGRGSEGVFIIDKADINVYKEKVAISDYIIQPFIKGTEYTVDTLHDFEGNLLNIIPRQRLMVESGISTMAKTVRDEKFIELISYISTRLKFAGGNCFQFIKSNEDCYYLTDINPRFGGGSILSIKSSKEYADNIIYLLNGETEKIRKNVFVFDEVTMYRGYEEFYL